MNVTICTIGELLMEFLTREENQGFSRPSEFWGPYPSEVPAVFADQVTGLGFGSMLFSCVGNDASDEMSTACLGKDGANVSSIAMLQKMTTGSTFVNYHSQAQRDSIFNTPNSAYGLLTAGHIDETLLDQCQHFHIMGLSLLLFRTIDMIHKVIGNIEDHNGTVSFDPDTRRGMLNIPRASQVFKYTLGYADILLPNDGELDHFGLNPERNRQIPVDNPLRRGVKHAVIKCGPHGAGCFSADETHHVTGFNISMTDPTGVRDCSGAIFISLFLNGATP